MRRLWQVGELARRQDGTFVLSERTAKATSQATGELDEAVRRLAERVRRDGHASTVRVRTVDPALLRAWCPSCRELVTPRLDGRCVTCGTQTGANLEAPVRPRRPQRTQAAAQGRAGVGAGLPRLRRPEGAPGAHLPRVPQAPAAAATTAGAAAARRPTHISEELLAEARRLYAGGLSLRQVAAELHPRTGYKTVASCAEALYGHFKRRGLEAPPAARGDRRAQPQARAQAHAGRRARSRTPTAAGWPSSAAGRRCRGRAGRCARRSSATRPGRAGRAGATRSPTLSTATRTTRAARSSARRATARMRARVGRQPTPTLEQAA